MERIDRISADLIASNEMLIEGKYVKAFLKVKGVIAMLQSLREDYRQLERNGKGKRK